MMQLAKPILFSGPMVRAILEGRKTMTRRVLKPQPETAPGMNCTRLRFRGGDVAVGDPLAASFTRFAVGDVLWVRETWGECEQWGGYLYRATHEGDDPIGNGWRPSIHMPRRASRVTLRVTGVRVERLQGISAADARAEGVEDRHGMWGTWNADGTLRCGGSHDPREAFRCLWININGNGSWGTNPWIAALTFSALKANVDCLMASGVTSAGVTISNAPASADAEVSEL
jgi:hypothetical protein